MSESISNTLNIDPAEQAKFDDLAASWWDLRGESRALHEINPTRIRYVRDRCDLKKANVVDVGCGGGILSEGLAAESAHVTGLDIADKALRVARLHLHESGLAVNYVNSTVEHYAAESPESADIITCMEMLEHVPEPQSAINACAKLVKPGGDLFFSTLNRTPSAFATAILGAEYVARLIPKGTHRYDRFIRPSELCAWTRAAGLEVCDISGMHYNPLNGTASLGGGVRVNYLLHAKKPQ